MRICPGNIGRYNLVRELGRGSMATVYLARDTFAAREVAIKVFEHDVDDAAETRGTHRTSFLNEAALVGKLDHPHIVALLDAAVETDFSYVVMDYVEGGTLARYARAGNLLAFEQVVEVAFKLSRALDYAQRHGVIHRDLKPANVMVTSTIDVKLSDFGVARLDNATRTDIANAGSPAYMSPEQLTDQAVSHQTDIYSLGVVMYQLLTGRLPFHASSTAGLMYQIVHHEAPRLRTLRTEIPEALEAIVSRAMHKDLRVRYQTWIEFGKDIANLVRRLEAPTEGTSDTRKFQALRDLAFFRDFREIEVWETLRFATWQHMSEDTVIIKEGDRGDALYLLVEGQAEVTRGDTLLATLGAGDLFGEMQYFVENADGRSTTIRAISPVLVLEIKGLALNAASDACQVQFNKACIRLLIERLSAANRRLAEH